MIDVFVASVMSIVILVTRKKSIPYLLSYFTFTSRKRTKRDDVIIQILFVFYPVAVLLTSLLQGSAILVLAMFATLQFQQFVELRKKHERRKMLRFYFPIWLRQLQILLQHNNVVTALTLSTNTAPLLIREDVKKLVERLQVDSQSYSSFLLFLDEDNMIEISRVMKVLYRCQHLGHQDAYGQLQRMIESTGVWLHEERIKREEGRAMFVQWWGMLPLLMVSILYMVMMFQIVVGILGKGVM